MPVDDRIVWTEEPTKVGGRLIGKIDCNICANLFFQERKMDKIDSKSIWKAKEEISNQLGQHKH